jgi:flagellar protein FlaG
MQIEIISTSAGSPVSLATETGLPGSSERSKVGVNEKADKHTELPDMQIMADDLQQNLKLFHNINLQFSVHQTSGKVVVAVTDEESGELIREIPSREMLKLSTKLEEMMGLLFDQKI